jgi:fibronectin-binding autotransporter adhesin
MCSILDQTMKVQPPNFSARQPRWLPVNLTLAAVLLSWLPCPLHGAVKTWDGSSDGNWGTGANWTPDIAPVDKDELVFPVAASRRWSTNNIAGLTLQSISFHGSNYVLFGNAVTLDKGMTADPQGGTNAVHFPITLSADQAFSVSNATAEVHLWSDIALNGHDLTLETFLGSIWHHGAFSGSGNLTQHGPGTVGLSGPTPNTYIGDFTVRGGLLLLDKDPTDGAITGPLMIGAGAGGTVRLLHSHQIGSVRPVTLELGALLDLNGYRETLDGLIFTGGEVQTGTGTLALSGDITAYPALGRLASIHGELSLNGLVRTFDLDGSDAYLDIQATITSGGLTKIGSGKLSLNASNSYALATTINEGTLSIGNGYALGSGAGGTIVNSGGVLSIAPNLTVRGEPLTLNGAGPDGYGALVIRDGWFRDTTVTLAGDTTIYCVAGGFDINGAIVGPGSLTKLGEGTVDFSGSVSNTYSGTTTVSQGTLVLVKPVNYEAIPAALVIGDNVGGTDADIVLLKNPDQIHDLAAVTIHSSGVLYLAGPEEWIGSLSGDGHLELGPGGGVIVGNNNASTTFSGLISGVGGSLLKLGTGRLTLTGDNSYSGQTIAGVGELIVNGSQPASPVVVSVAGTLGGTGTVGHLNCIGGVVQPGASPGLLTCSNLALNADSTLRVELNGLGKDADQLHVRGTNNLGGATLEVALGFTPARGDTFTILNNDGHDAIVGTFAGLTNGATLRVGLADFRINYDGGSGNDVVLRTTRVYEPLVITAVTPSGTNLDLHWTSSRPDYLVEKTTTLGTNMTWQAVSAPTTETRATVPMDTTAGFYRVRGGN